MFNIGGGEMVVLAILALLVFGPEGLPDIVRTVTRTLRAFRTAANDFQQEFQTALDTESQQRRVTERRRRKVAVEPRNEAASGEPEASEAPPTEADTSEAVTGEVASNEVAHGEAVSNEIALEASDSSVVAPLSANDAKVPVPTASRLEPNGSTTVSSSALVARPLAAASQAVDSPSEPEGATPEPKASAVGTEANASDAVADEATAQERSALLSGDAAPPALTDDDQDDDGPGRPMSRPPRTLPANLEVV